MSEFTEDEMCMDPCCAKDLSDRRKASSLMKKLANVDVSTAKQKKMEIYGNLFCCPCQDKACLVGDYALLRALRNESREVYGEELLSDQSQNQNGASGNLDSDSDAELDDLLNEFENDEQMQALNSERISLMKQHQEMLDMSKAHGFGIHRPLRHDDETAIRYIVSSPRTIIHVCDDKSRLCAFMDLFLESKSPLYPGTAFLRVAPAPSSPLAIFLKLSTTSGLLALKRGDIIASTRDLSQFGDSTFIDKDQVSIWLDRSGVLESSPQPHEWSSIKWPVELAQDEDDQEYYSCGHPGCKKTFRHDHVSQMLPAEYLSQPLTE